MSNDQVSVKWWESATFLSGAAHIQLQTVDREVLPEHGVPKRFSSVVNLLVVTVK